MNEDRVKIHKIWKEFFNAAELLMSTEDWAGLSELMASRLQNARSMDTMNLMSIVRTTACACNRVPKWRSYRDEVADELQRRGLNSKNILTGLHDEQLEKSFPMLARALLGFHVFNPDPDIGDA